jgi:hypothetical protein
MNRHQRRAAKTKHIDKKLDPVIAIHEAGHAVARVLSAEDFGLPAEKMISHIEVGNRQNMGVSHFDKSVTTTCQATTYGPTFSAELHSVFIRITKDIEPNKLTQQHIIDAVKLAKNEGIDIIRWLRARMLITTLGPVAEAAHTGRFVDDVWNSIECEGDQMGAVEEGKWAGLTNEQIVSNINEAIDRSVVLMGQTNVQRAVYALADALPISGKLKGQRAAFIITRALAGTD